MQSEGGVPAQKCLLPVWMVTFFFFLDVNNKEKSRDQDGLNQASVRSVCKTKYFPSFIWMKEQTLSVRVQINHNANPQTYAVNIDNS